MGRARHGGGRLPKKDDGEQGQEADTEAATASAAAADVATGVAASAAEEENLEGKSVVGSQSSQELRYPRTLREYWIWRDRRIVR